MAYYYPGSTGDRQSRIAQSSQNFDQVRGTPLSLIGKDALPPGQSTHDSRRPIGYLVRTTRFQAQIASHFDQVHNTPLALQGKDALNTVGQSAYETTRPAAALSRALRFVALIASNVDQVHATPLSLLGKDATNAGQQSVETTRPKAAWLRQFRFPIYDANSGFAFLPEQTVTNPQGPTTANTELPPRAASRAIDLRTYVDASEFWIFGTDAMVTGQQSYALAPSPPARLRDYSLAASFPLSLIGQDAMATGAQSTALPPPGASRARDYSITDTLIPDLVSQDAMATGQQSFALPPSPAPLRLRDYSVTESFPLTLISQDATNAGAQSTALPPIPALRARDYTFAPPINLPTLTTVVQQIPYGAQVTDALSPRAAARARDYTWTQELIPNLIGQDQLNAGAQSFALAPSPAPLRARDYSISEAFLLTLISQDSFNAGKQSFDLPPIAAPRSRDYSFVPPINLPCLTTVVQQIPYGLQLTDALPARAAARAKEYSWSQDLIPNLIGQDQRNAGSQLFDLAPQPAPLRLRDYTLAESFPLTLNGQDAMAVGAQRTELPPIAALRARDYSFVPPANLSCLTTVVQPIPYGQQSTDNLPPRPAPRARDYTFTAAFVLGLNGQDAMAVGQQRTALTTPAPQRSSTLSDPGINVTILITTVPLPAGAQQTELPARSPLRLKDYTYLWPVQTKLIGQDAFPTGQNADRTALPPKAAARSRDYTHLQSYPLYIYEQLPAGQSTSVTEGPPRGPLRLRDYTHYHALDQQLAGQDSMVTGQSWLRADNLPPRAYARLVDYTWFSRFSLPDLISHTKPGHHTLTDRALYEHTLYDRALYAHTLADQEVSS